LEYFNLKSLFYGENPKLKIENKNEKKVFSVFEHELVPKHIVLSKEEAEEVLKKYHVKPYQLPYIKKNDPAIKEIGAKPGDIVKIIRKSPTAGEAVAYRYVVE
jgi:DNA-directed RNA polymerase subunit H